MAPTLMWLVVVIMTLALIQSRRHQMKLLMELKQARKDLITAAVNGQDMAVKLKENEKKLKIKDVLILQQNKTIEEYVKSIATLREAIQK